MQSTFEGGVAILESLRVTSDIFEEINQGKPVEIFKPQIKRWDEVNIGDSVYLVKGFLNIWEQILKNNPGGKIIKGEIMGKDALPRELFRLTVKKTHVWDTENRAWKEL